MKKTITTIFYTILFYTFSIGQTTPRLSFSFDKNIKDQRGTIQNIEHQNITFTTDRYGKENAAAHFNGENALIKIPYNINPSQTPNFTILFWVKPDYNNQIMTLFAHDNDPVLGIDRKFTLAVGNNAPSYFGKVIAQKWSLIAGIFDQKNGSACLYVDGKLIAQEAIMSEGSPYFHLGNHPTKGNFFKGDLDDVRIYDKALEKDEIDKIFEKEAKASLRPIGEKQYHYTTKNPKAEILVRVGDVDNFGFDTRSGFNPFCKNNRQQHVFPLKTTTQDYTGTDKILVGSSYKKGKIEIKADDYLATTNWTAQHKTVIPLIFPAPKTVIKSAMFQILIGDFQAPLLGSSFQFSINGKRIPYIEAALNAIEQTKLMGQLFNFSLLKEDLALLKNGEVLLSIDDPTTGVGDGFAIDFVQLLINLKQNNTCTGTIKGTVTDENGNPLPNVLISNAMTQTVTDKKGRFIIKNALTGLISLNGQKTGYIPTYQNVELNKNKKAKIDLVLVKKATETLTDFIRQELKQKGAVTLHNVVLTVGEDDPSPIAMPDSKMVLQALYTILKTQPDLKIRIEGHTNSDGEVKDNQAASLLSARNVKRWLSIKGIPFTRLKAIGLGASTPIATNQLTEGKALNKRIEIKVIIP